MPRAKGTKLAPLADRLPSNFKTRSAPITPIPVAPANSPVSILLINNCPHSFSRSFRLFLPISIFTVEASNSGLWREAGGGALEVGGFGCAVFRDSGDRT